MPVSQTLSRPIDRELFYTDERLLPGIVNIAFQHSPVATIFLADQPDGNTGPGRMNGMGKESPQTGQKVQFNIRVSENGTFKRMSGPWDTHPTQPGDTGRRAEDNWKHGSDATVLNDFDQYINAGPEALANVLTEERMHTVAGCVDAIAQDIVASSSATNAINSIPELIGANDSVHGLSGASFPNWNSRGLSARGTAPASVSFAGGSFAAVGIANLRTAANNCTEGTLEPNLHLTTYDAHSYYEGTVVVQERYAAPTDTGDAGVLRLAFRRAPVIADPHIVAGDWYMINTDYLKYIPLRGADFQAKPWKQATEQEAMVSEVQVKGQLCIKDRRLNNKITGITA